jgi:hypothetical protein
MDRVCSIASIWLLYKNWNGNFLSALIVTVAESRKREPPLPPTNGCFELVCYPEAARHRADNVCEAQSFLFSAYKCMASRTTRCYVTLPDESPGDRFSARDLIGIPRCSGKLLLLLDICQWQQNSILCVVRLPFQMTTCCTMAQVKRPEQHIFMNSLPTLNRTLTLLPLHKDNHKRSQGTDLDSCLTCWQSAGQIRANSGEKFSIGLRDMIFRMPAMKRQKYIHAFQNYVCSWCRSAQTFCHWSSRSSNTHRWAKSLRTSFTVVWHEVERA